MPQVKNPGSIKTGPGKSTQSPTDKLALLGAGMAGAPPNVGQPGYFPPNSSTAKLGVPPLSSDGDGGLMVHVSNPIGAHDASAISLNPQSRMLFASNVQSSTNELASGVAPRPPMLGQHFPHMTFSGITDWGSLKLHDSSRTDNPDEYPYYHSNPSPTGDWTPALAASGCDPLTDPVWNGTTVGGINHVPGTGLGLTKAGAYTDGGNGRVKRGRALALQISAGPTNRVVPVTVSGSIFPSDRGVLALIHWPSTDSVNAFKAQSPLQKVVAAILLGSGIASDSCSTGDMSLCDGGPGIGKSHAKSGSIFSVGVGADGKIDQFAYPGQATGQYDLHEINTGASGYTGENLPGVGVAPWWGSGWVRTVDDVEPGAGQVRWGTDPTADTFDPVAQTPYGIPVLGAGVDAYTPAPNTTSVTVVNPYGGVDTFLNTIGSSIITSSNFFRYRLPYLKDYSRATGLKYTPRGVNAYKTRETKRYFSLATDSYVSDPTRMTIENTVEYLNQAGNYDNFGEDHYGWQIGRYRHSFFIPSSDTAGPGRIGTYWMIHFKKEADFESFVRDGNMPWDPTPNGYEVYGASPVDSSSIVSGSGQVNTTVNFTGNPGTGPAPNYGFGSKSYHVLRPSILTADNTTLPTVMTRTFGWSLNPVAGPGTAATVMYISGVAYFLPRNDDGNWNFKLSGIHLEIADPWLDFYRTDDNPLTGDNSPVPPARLSSPCPLFFGIAPFAYESVLTVGTDIPDSVFGHLSPRYQRLEVPLNKLGAFSDNVGPINGDTIEILDLGTGVEFPGDVDYPIVCSDTILRAFIRRPLAMFTIQPTDPIGGDGVALIPTGAVADSKILYHSTKWNLNDQTAGHYGNFITGGVPSPIYSALATATKDTEERFLDETYRYNNTLGAEAAYNQILGPGMSGWFVGPIPTPVQIGLDTSTFVSPFGAPVSWQGKSFAQQGNFHVSLELPDLIRELQVAGTPTRNPSFISGASVPAPSSGILLHPKTNYTNGYVPDSTADGGALPGAQPNYSVLDPATRSFIRCFDAAFVRGSYAATVENQPLVVIRIDGLKLEDFRYTAPGHGGLGDGVDDTKFTGIAIMVKVPGQTTWMDLGRVDGSGPSKQDNALDGAGCQVQGPNTFDSVDPVTGMVYCQVKVNVGPGVNLTGGQDVGGQKEVPVMVKVVMNNLAQDYDLTQTYTGFPGQFDGTPAPGAKPVDVRGLCGIKVVHPLAVESI